MASEVAEKQAEAVSEDGSAPASAASKVKASIEAKGENSYYFAHAGEKDDLTKATRIEGDGTRLLAKPDGMAKVEVEAIELERKVRWREDYAWGDEGSKVKVYLEFPEGSLGTPELKVEPKFEDWSFEVVVSGVAGSSEIVGVTNGAHRLSGKIVPEKCQWRLNSSKSRLTVTLVKVEEQESWSTLKKHNISQHTGWN
mmetsp:Transcript_130140/g.278081  ORF Transcript_130140/g.278081 Transcript_130140/m.278081 type:complete len:198 (-) Transcript_130140:44-637(-)